jgi:hypothetical protein
MLWYVLQYLKTRSTSSEKEKFIDVFDEKKNIINILQEAKLTCGIE